MEPSLFGQPACQRGGATDPALEASDNEGVAHVDYLNLANIVKLGVGFLLVFTAVFALENLAPQLLRDLGFGGLGFVSVAVIYATHLISCFLAPTVLQNLNERRALPIATLFYALYCASGLLPATCPHCSRIYIVAHIIIASALFGFSAAFVWVPQGAIMTLNAPQEHVNTYMTIFQSLFQTTGLVASVISSFIVHSPPLFFAVFTGISLAGTAVLATIQPNKLHASIPRRSRVDKGPATLLDAVRPMLRFIAGDRRARAVSAYSFLVGVLFIATPICVVSMFAPDTAGTTKLLTGIGSGRLFTGLIFGRLSDAVGRLPVMLIASYLEAMSLLSLAVSSAFGSGGGDGIALAATVPLGLGNGLQFANLAACITAAVHDEAYAAFATQQSFICCGAVAAVVVLPQISRNVAIAVCISVQVAVAAFLCSQPSFFRTLAVSEEDPREQPEEEPVPLEEAAEAGTRLA